MSLLTKEQIERGDRYRELYSKHVQHPDGHWKGRAFAIVPKEIAQEVADSMDYMGSTVDIFREVGDRVLIKSAGYWAHGF